jgi:ketosteroid isomerase-like protein
MGTPPIEAVLADANRTAVATLFAAVATRDLPTILSCYAPDVTIREAASLPYGGTYHGADGAHEHALAVLAHVGC